MSMTIGDWLEACLRVLGWQGVVLSLILLGLLLWLDARVWGAPWSK